MTDSIRSVSSVSSLRATSEAKAASPARRVASAPNAPIACLTGALSRPLSVSADSAASTVNVARALTALGAARAFGPQFKFVKLSEAEAVSAAALGLGAVKANIRGAGFAGAPHQFTPVLAFKDELGRTSVRMNRSYAGVEIYGAQAIAHLDENGKAKDITGEAIPARLPFDVQPTVREEVALEKALTAFGAKPTRTGGPALQIVKTDDGAYHLAFHAVLVSDAKGETPRQVHYFVDAHSGELLPLTFDEQGGYVSKDDIAAARSQLSRGPRIAPEGTTPAPVPPTVADGTGNSLYSGVVPVATSPDGGKFVLRDPSAAQTETRDAKNGEGGSGAENIVFVDDNNKWGEPTDDARVRAGIDAHYAAVQYLAYLKALFGRNSIDDKGLRLLSNVHVQDDYVNAYWDGSSMNYGDGDGRIAGPMVDRDIGGHEISHGLTQFTSGLIYRGESGALNEAGSDIIGSAGLSWFMRGMKDQGIEKDYLLGEDAFTPGKEGDAFRYMDNPSRDKPTRGERYSRDNYGDLYKGSSDNGGVHINSGIANNFFFLLAAGGLNHTSNQKVEKGIGMEKALRIYYRAHTVYFTPSTTFAQARVALEKAATDLFGAGSVELATVKAAAKAVGIPETTNTGVTLVG